MVSEHTISELSIITQIIKDQDLLVDDQHKIQLTFQLIQMLTY